MKGRRRDRAPKPRWGEWGEESQRGADRLRRHWEQDRANEAEEGQVCSRREATPRQTVFLKVKDRFLVRAGPGKSARDFSLAFWEDAMERAGKCASFLFFWRLLGKQLFGALLPPCELGCGWELDLFSQFLSQVFSKNVNIAVYPRVQL